MQIWLGIRQKPLGGHPDVFYWARFPLVLQVNFNQVNWYGVCLYQVTGACLKLSTEHRILMVKKRAQEIFCFPEIITISQQDSFILFQFYNSPKYTRKGCAVKYISESPNVRSKSSDPPKSAFFYFPHVWIIPITKELHSSNCCLKV